MTYMIMVCETDSAFRARTHETGKVAYWRAYTQALRDSGVMTGGHGLQPPLTATTVRLRGGARSVQDGPYAEAKEQLGGYYIIDVPDLDTALEWAARCPAAADGTVEVRPVLTM